MIIQSITLKNFRNHADYQLEFNRDTTLILGENGCGKTSVLEAIYILTRGKSFRATDSDIVRRGTDFYRASLMYCSGEQISVTYTNNKKTFSTVTQKTNRLPKKHKYPVVIFLPSDLNLISGSPTRHRDYFDQMFDQFSDEYHQAISRYQKALRQRNELLKTDHATPGHLFSWNILLSKYGTIINNYRKTFIQEINQSLNQLYGSIAENQDEVFLQYTSESSDLSESDYLAKLERDFAKDTLLGHTTFGVHRDNFEFIFNRQLADTSASRGETRSIILALKFLEANLIFDKLQKKPLILLDDVFSELDETRRRCLVNNFKNHQVIITSVNDIINT